jgi:ABC-type metal ion transport system substrate-binding protein
MYFDVVKAQYIDDYRIKLEFEDGSTGTVDLSDYLKGDTVFRAFQDIGYFKDFNVRYGTLIWGSGEVDIAPETLYSMATGRPVQYRALKNQKT